MMDPAISNKTTAILMVPNVFIVRLQSFGPGAEKKSNHFSLQFIRMRATVEEIAGTTPGLPGKIRYAQGGQAARA